jgi:hypothetical protein
MRSRRSLDFRGASAFGLASRDVSGGLALALPAHFLLGQGHVMPGLPEESPQPTFSLGQGSAADFTRKLDPIRFGNVVQDGDGRPVSEQNPLCVDSH